MVHFIIFLAIVFIGGPFVRHLIFHSYAFWYTLATIWVLGWGAVALSSGIPGYLMGAALLPFVVIAMRVGRD